MPQVTDKNGCVEFMHWFDSRYRAMIESVSAIDRVNAEAYRLGAVVWMEIGVHWDDDKIDISPQPGAPPPIEPEAFDIQSALADLQSHWRKYVDSSRRPGMRKDVEASYELPYTLFSELIDKNLATPEDASFIDDAFIEDAAQTITTTLGLDEEVGHDQGMEQAINQGLPQAPEPSLRELPPQPRESTRPAGKAGSVRPGQSVAG